VFRKKCQVCSQPTLVLLWFWYKQKQILRSILKYFNEVWIIKLVNCVLIVLNYKDGEISLDFIGSQGSSSVELSRSDDMDVVKRRNRRSSSSHSNRQNVKIVVTHNHPEVERQKFFKSGSDKDEKVEKSEWISRFDFNILWLRSSFNVNT